MRSDEYEKLYNSDYPIVNINLKGGKRLDNVIILDIYAQPSLNKDQIKSTLNEKHGGVECFYSGSRNLLILDIVKSWSFKEKE